MCLSIKYDKYEVCYRASQFHQPTCFKWCREPVHYRACELVLLLLLHPPPVKCPPPPFPLHSLSFSPKVDIHHYKSPSQGFRLKKRLPWFFPYSPILPFLSPHPHSSTQMMMKSHPTLLVIIDHHHNISISRVSGGELSGIARCLHPSQPTTIFTLSMILMMVMMVMMVAVMMMMIGMMLNMVMMVMMIVAVMMMRREMMIMKMCLHSKYL